MKERKMVVLGMGVLFLMALSSYAYALSDLNVQICGNEVSISSGATEVTLSESDGSEKLYSSCNIGIAGTTDGPAKVRTDDSGQDKIWLENAIIRATSGNVNGDIVFWATFAEGPTAQNNPVTFRRYQTGTLKRGNNAATQDTFEISAWIEGNEIYQSEIKNITCSPPSCANINIPTRSEDWNPVSLQGPREMMGQFWFYLKLTNDKLTLTNVTVDTQGGGGAERPDSIANPKCSDDPSIGPGRGGKKIKCLKK